MAFSDYTSTTSVRAALGVSPREAKDDLITDNLRLIHLLEELDAFGPSFRADYEIARDAEPRNTAQNRLVLLTEAYSAYTVALDLIPILPVAVPLRQTDGKTEVERVDNPYEKLRPQLEKSRDLFRDRLRAAYAAITGETAPVKVTRVRFAAVGAGPDTVTDA